VDVNLNSQLLSRNSTPRRVLPMSRGAARNAVQLAKLVTVMVVDMAALNARCFLRYALPVEKTPQCHSSPVEIGLFTAGIAIDRNPVAIAGK